MVFFLSLNPRSNSSQEDQQPAGLPSAPTRPAAFFSLPHGHLLREALLHANIQLAPDSTVSDQSSLQAMPLPTSFPMQCDHPYLLQLLNQAKRHSISYTQWPAPTCGTIPTFFSHGHVPTALSFTLARTRHSASLSYSLILPASMTLMPWPYLFPHANSTHANSSPMHLQ